jgi:phosphoribosyl-dephospho-CoA transferase
MKNNPEFENIPVVSLEEVLEEREKRVQRQTE